MVGRIAGFARLPTLSRPRTQHPALGSGRAFALGRTCLRRGPRSLGYEDFARDTAVGVPPLIRFGVFFVLLEVGVVAFEHFAIEVQHFAGIVLRLVA